VDSPQNETRHEQSPVSAVLPARSSSFLKRRRDEGQRAYLERAVRAVIDVREQNLEQRLEADSTTAGASSFETQRALGLITLLESHWERAHAHLHRAHELNAHDLETHVNLGIVLARRGQLQPALELLEAARQQWPDTPLILFNLGLVALQARRAPLVLEAAAAIERLWQDNPALAADYHDGVLSMRGLALLLLNETDAARATLTAAARHIPFATQPHSPPSSVGSQTSDDAAEAHHGEAAADDEMAANVPPDESHDDARELAAGGDTHLVEDQSLDADLLNNLAVAEAQAGAISGAVAHLVEALRLEPGHSRALNNLGVLAYQQGDVATAFKYIDLARRIEEYMERPEATTFNHLGVLLAARGKVDESVEQFERAGNLEHGEFEVFYNLGRAYIEQGAADRGVEYLRRAYQMDPAHADVHVLLGAAYLLRGQANLMAEALKHLKRALQINPQHHAGLTNLVMALLEIKNAEGALRVIQQTLRLRPKSVEALFLLGLITFDLGDEKHWAQAVIQFNAVLDSRPDLTAALYNSALSQYLMGLRDISDEHLQIVVKRDPSFAPAYYLLGVGHANARRFKEALEAWQTAARYEPQNADLQANMGFIHYHRGDWPNAIKCFMQAHGLAPGDAGILASLGLCFARANMLNQAVSTFVRSLEIRPRSPVTHSNLGLAYFLHKHVEQAIAHWRVVSQLDSAYASRREEEQQRSFDDSLVELRPLNWRARVVKIAPTLPRPHTRLLPGYNTRELRPVVTDPELQQVQESLGKMEHLSRWLAAMSVR